MGKAIVIELGDLLEPKEMDEMIQRMLEQKKESCTLFRYENETGDITYGSRSDLCYCVRSGEKHIQKNQYLPTVSQKNRQDIYHTLKSHI